MLPSQSDAVPRPRPPRVDPHAKEKAMDRQARYDLERGVLKLQQSLYPPGGRVVSAAHLMGCCRCFTPDLYAEVVEERASMKLCGYPLCGNPIVTERRGKLRVSRVTMTISAPDEIFQFCSLPCRKASRYLQGQISRELVYMRTRNPKLYDVQLLGGPKVDRKQRPPPAAGAPDGRNTLGAAAMPFRHQIVSHGPSAPLSAQPLGAGAGAAAGAGAGAAAAARRDSGRGGSPRPSDSAAGTLEVEPPVMADAVVERHVVAAPTAPSLVPGTQLSIPIQITDADRDRAAAHDDGGDHDVDVDDVDTGGGA